MTMSCFHFCDEFYFDKIRHIHRKDMSTARELSAGFEGITKCYRIMVRMFGTPPVCRPVVVLVSPGVAINTVLSLSA
jgi:hypothetical protein